MYMLKQKLAVILGLFVLVLSLVSFSAGPVFAQTDPAPNNGDPGAAQTCKDGTLDNALCSPKCKDSTDCNLTKKYINPFINKFLAPVAVLSVIIGIIWGSIEFATSAGDAQRAASGKGKIQKALIGLIAFLFLYAFLKWLIPGGIV
jgi:hypothetical protein